MTCGLFLPLALDCVGGGPEEEKTFEDDHEQGDAEKHVLGGPKPDNPGLGGVLQREDERAHAGLEHGTAYDEFVDQDRWHRRPARCDVADLSSGADEVLVPGLDRLDELVDVGGVVCGKSECGIADAQTHLDPGQLGDRSVHLPGELSPRVVAHRCGQCCGDVDHRLGQGNLPGGSADHPRILLLAIQRIRRENGSENCQRCDEGEPEAVATHRPARRIRVVDRAHGRGRA